MGQLPFERIKTLQPGAIVEPSLLHGIQDGIINLDQPIPYTPTVVGVDPADYSTQRGVYILTKYFVDLWVTVTWTNVVNSPAQDNTDVQISIPWTPATLAVGGSIPVVSQRPADNVGSMWPDDNTDDGLDMFVIHFATPDNVLRVRRVQNNANVGALKVGNTLTQVVGSIRYFTDPAGQLLI